MLLWKEVLTPGTYYAQRRWVVVTSKDLETWVSQFKAMRKAGLSVPVPYEHPKRGDFGSQPVDRSEADTLAADRAKTNAGWVKRLTLRSGKLFSLLSINDADAERLKSQGGYVSPHFGSWHDGDGRTWSNAVLHMALTLHPVNHRQSSRFVPAKPEAKSSFSVSDFSGISFSLLDKAAPMPSATLKPKAKKSEKPAAGGAKDAAAGDKAGTSFGGAECKSGKSASMSEDSPGEEMSESGEGSSLKEIIAEMADMGIVLPEDWDGDYDVLKAALLSHKKTKSGGEQPAEAPSGKSKPKETSVSPVSMSIEQLSENPIVASLLKDKADAKKAGMLARVDALVSTGRCTIPQANTIRGLIGTHSFSATSDDPDREIEIRIATLEGNPANAFANIKPEDGADASASFSSGAAAGEKEADHGSFFLPPNSATNPLPPAQVESEVDRILGIKK